MKFNKIIIAAALLLSSSAAVQAQQIDRLTQAMLKSYEQILSEDPRDYLTLYDRAATYYQLGKYELAFSDISKALDCTPKRDIEMRMQEYSLLSDISLATEDYDKALEAIDKALEIEPKDYANTYKKGNVLLYLKQPEEAYRIFSGMQSLKSRSQEAYFGMAKANIMMGKDSEARQLIKEAENADPSNPVTFCRIGDIYSDMGETENAATNYIMAISLGRDNARPIGSLVELAGKDYNGVASAFDYAISKTTKKAPLYFMKSDLAYNAGHYAEAEALLNQLMKSQEGQVAAVYGLMADTELALGKNQEALAYVAKASELEPQARFDLTQSHAELAAGNPASALIAAKNAMGIGKGDITEALMAAAQASIALDNGKEALNYLNQLIMERPEDVEALLTRGYVYENLLKDQKQAIADFQRAANVDADKFPAVAYKALAKSKAGKHLDAGGIIERAEKSASSPSDYYYAAIYYAQTGNLEKSAEMINKAKAQGFQNQYLLNGGNSAFLNLAPIKHLLK